MLRPEFSGQFKRDYKLAVKRGCDPKKLETVITMLCAEQPLPAEYRDHALTNSRNYKGMRECHIQPDWLLVYRVRHEILVLQLIRRYAQRFVLIVFQGAVFVNSQHTRSRQATACLLLFYRLSFRPNEFIKHRNRCRSKLCEIE